MAQLERHARAAIAAAGAVFDRAGWPWRAEFKKKHTQIFATDPAGKEWPVCVISGTRPRTGEDSNALIAGWSARRFLNTRGVRVK